MDLRINQFLPSGCNSSHFERRVSGLLQKKHPVQNYPSERVKYHVEIPLKHLS